MKKLALAASLALLFGACGGTEANPSIAPETSAAPLTPAADSGDAATDPAGADTDGAAESHDDDSLMDEAGHEDDSHMDEADHDEDSHMDETGHDDDSHMDETGHDDDTDHADGDADADRVVEVALTEFAFEPESFHVAAGETIEFMVTNLGVVEHEFRLSNEHRIEEHIAAGHADHGDEGGHHEGGDVILLLDPGETGSVTVMFTDDTTVYTDVVCLIPGHYEAGMSAPLDYQA